MASASQFLRWWDGLRSSRFRGAEYVFIYAYVEIFHLTNMLGTLPEN